MTSFLGLGGWSHLIPAIKRFGKLEVAREKLLCFAICVPCLLLLAPLWHSKTLSFGFSTFYNLFTFRTVARVKISVDHELYDTLLSYMVGHGLMRPPQNLALRSQDGEIEETGAPVLSSSEQDLLDYVPDVGVYPFEFNRVKMTFERRHWHTTSARSRYHGLTTCRKGAIVISYASITGTTEPIKKFLRHVSTTSSKKSCTMIWKPYRATNNEICWRKTATRPLRSLDTVFLERGRKDDIVGRTKTYLRSSNQKFRSSRGLPWYYMMLFHGPPGTGKTSFCTALAGDLGLDIYTISTSDELSDEELATLSGMVDGSKGIMILKDVDECGTDRDAMSRRRSGFMSPDEIGDATTKRITTAGILSITTGEASKEGRIVLMTAKDRDNIDAILLHDGGINHQFYFDYATADVAIDLFKHTFSPALEETPDGEEKFDVEEINRLAIEFESKFPSRAVTAAEIQDFLLRHRGDPNASVHAAEDHFSPIARARNNGMGEPARYRPRPRPVTVVTETEDVSPPSSHDSNLVGVLSLRR